MTKTKIALAAALFAATSSAAFAQGFDPNMANRYPGYAQPNTYGYSSGGRLGMMNSAPADTLQSAPVSLRSTATSACSPRRCCSSATSRCRPPAVARTTRAIVSSTPIASTARRRLMRAATNGSPGPAFPLRRFNEKQPALRRLLPSRKPDFQLRGVHSYEKDQDRTRCGAICSHELGGFHTGNAGQRAHTPVRADPCAAASQCSPAVRAGAATARRRAAE